MVFTFREVGRTNTENSIDVVEALGEDRSPQRLLGNDESTKRNLIDELLAKNEPGPVLDKLSTFGFSARLRGRKYYEHTTSWNVSRDVDVITNGLVGWEPTQVLELPVSMSRVTRQLSSVFIPISPEEKLTCPRGVTDLNLCSLIMRRRYDSYLQVEHSHLRYM